MSINHFNDSGSNYQFTDKLINPDIRKSQFVLSYVNTMTAKQGQIIPVWFSYYYPNEDFNVSIDNLIRVVNPPVVPLMSRQRVFFHLFKMDYSQLWTYWDAMMKKGWSGNFEATLPTVSAPLAVNGAINPLLARGSLADYLGFNFGDYTYQSGDEDIDVELPALPFLAYQMIYRNYYLNKNIGSAFAFASDEPVNKSYRVFFPDSDYDLMLKTVNPLNLTLDGSSQETDEPFNALPLGKLRYRDFALDYFTSSLPWPMRGDMPVLEGSIQFTGDVPVVPGSSPITFTKGSLPSFSQTTGTIELTPSYFSATNSNSSVLFGFIPENADNTGSTSFVRSASFTNGTLPTLSAIGNDNYKIDASSLNSFIAGLAVTQPQLKQLWTNTLIAEKMARTDGTYGEFIRTFFSSNPSHHASHLPQYIGGTFQPIVFSQVLQTSPADSGTLGTVGASGISSSSSHVGSFSTDDFGIAMVLMSIMPDTYYSQGWMREHLYRTQSDFPLPERAALGMQPIYRGELYYDARDVTNDKNGDLFGYQSRLDELRYRQNEIHGEVANPNNLSFSPYVQSRTFDGTENLNPVFLSTEDNIDNSWLTAPNEVPYIVQVANRVQATRPYPYIAPPSAVML